MAEKSFYHLASLMLQYKTIGCKLEKRTYVTICDSMIQNLEYIYITHAHQTIIRVMFILSVGRYWSHVHLNPLFSQSYNNRTSPREHMMIIDNSEHMHGTSKLSFHRSRKETQFTMSDIYSPISNKINILKTKKQKTNYCPFDYSSSSSSLCL